MWRSIEELLTSRFRSSPWSAQVAATRAIQIFSQYLDTYLVDVELRQTIHPRSYSKGVLTLDVDHPAIAQKLRQDEPQILLDLRGRITELQRLSIHVGRSTAAPSS